MIHSHDDYDGDEEVVHALTKHVFKHPVVRALIDENGGKSVGGQVDWQAS